MAFNPAQFKQKKKRPVDPNAPPRPNLMSHDKKIRDSQAAFDELQRQVIMQAQAIESLQAKFADMQNSIQLLTHYVRRK